MLAIVEKRLNRIHSSLAIHFNRPSLDRGSRVLGLRLIE
jgi:hypothetical protein